MNFRETFTVLDKKEMLHPYHKDLEMEYQPKSFNGQSQYDYLGRTLNYLFKNKLYTSGHNLREYLRGPEEIKSIRDLY